LRVVLERADNSRNQPVAALAAFFTGDFAKSGSFRAPPPNPRKGRVTRSIHVVQRRGDGAK
jgi:hypothetical protein